MTLQWVSLKKILKDIVEDNLGQMLREAEEGCETEKESRDLKRMLEDYRTLLYLDC